MNIVGRFGDGVGGGCYPEMIMTFVCVDILGCVQMNTPRMKMIFVVGKHIYFLT